MVNSNQPESKPFCIPKRPRSLFQAIIYLLFGLCLCQELPQQLQQQQHQPTPVIGGLCRLDSADVQIGGKQTQFFLRCEPTPESAPGDGVWVVKSRTAGTTASRIPASALVKSEQQQQQQRKAAPKTTTYLCDLVSDAYEHGFCSTPENCLQPVYGDRNAFLQCNPTIARWSKKHCQQGFTFDFERQACIAHTTAVKPGHQFRQFPSKLDDDPVAAPAADAPMEPAAKQQPKGIVCTFSQCSSSEPCNVGTCNNGYCCSAAVGSLPASNFPAEYPKAASAHPNPTTGHSNYSSSSSNAGQSPMPPSILVIAFNEQSPTVAVADGPSTRLEDFTGDGTAGTGYSLQRLLAALRQQQQGGSSSFLPRSEPAAGRFARWCSPCMPFSLLVSSSDQQIGGVSPNLFSTSSLFNGGGGGICPGGVAPLTSCASTGYCSPPLQCVQPGICCSMPAPLPPPIPQAAYACPGGLPALGQCIGGRCFSPSAVCTSPANVCCSQAVVPAAIPATVCPDGTQAAGACVNNLCGAGFTCNQGLCCTNSSQTPRCLDGSQSIGACIQGRCGTGYTCTTGNICCPSQLNPCPAGQVSIGQAVNGRCPTGFTNVNGQCCGTQSQQSQISCPEIDSTGPCDASQQCPEAGFACDTANNWCCPQVFENEDAIGPCIQGEGGTRLCPEGYACVGEGDGECRRLDTGTCPPQDQLGPCGPNNECPDGYECIEGFCCRIDNSTARRFRQRRRKRQADGNVPPVQSAFLRLVRGSRKH